MSQFVVVEAITLGIGEQVSLPIAHNGKIGIPPGSNVNYRTTDQTIAGLPPTLTGLKEGTMTVKATITLPPPDATVVQMPELQVTVVKFNYRMVPTPV